MEATPWIWCCTRCPTDMNYTIQRYTPELESAWNNLIARSKNGTFLLDRKYMDYHQDRFSDHSLLVYSEEKVVAVFPANVKEKVVQSHGGLSYGGLIYTTKQKASEVLEIIRLILDHFRNLGFHQLIYKATPDIYHQYPAAEAEYALFRIGATLYRRDISSTFPLAKRLKRSKGRRWLLARAKKQGLHISKSHDFQEFFEAYTQHLSGKYDAVPVHTPQEMELLHGRFPEQIQYWQVRTSEGQFLGGSILYCTKKVIHAQYIHFMEEGKEAGAFDLLMETIEEQYADREYFDFGISTEQEGHFLNEGLIGFKESFGARGTLCNFYQIQLQDEGSLS